MVKLYKRYQQNSCFGVVSSGLVLADGDDCISNSLSNVVSWNVKRGTSTVLFEADKLVTCLAKFESIVAVGYSDGSIRLFDYRNSNENENGKELIVFNGHRAPITALVFDKNGKRLASGSNDTDVILWDIVAEEGLARFKGHKDQITCISFLESQNIDHIVSASKDTVIKVWDISAKCCVETIVSHRGEVWALSIENDVMLTGASDGLLRVFQIDFELLSSKFQANTISSSDEKTPTIQKSINFVGSLERKSDEKILNIRFHSSRTYFGVQGSEKTMEIYKIKSESEVAKSLKRKQKRALKKGSEVTATPELNDKIGAIAVVRCTSKIRSFDFQEGFRNNHIRLFLGMSNNSIEAFEISTTDANSIPRQISCIELEGHRTDVRTIALSEDDTLLASGSSDRVKIYSLNSKTCLQTLSSGYALCCIFLPGNKHLVVGTKTGELQLFDLSSSSLLETINAHDGAIWSMQLLPDKSGIVTGSQDKHVKFWTFQMVLDSEYSQVQKRISLSNSRTLKLTDDVLSVRVSPDGKLLAVAMLDLTVKIFYVDSLKFFLSLYGHKLPVVSMDISFDSRIIVTASSDKTVKIWGLDFGDCHKSILAHEDAVMATQFVWGTYYFFTVSKDKTVKYFDGEKFEEICMLEGHFGQVWALAVAKYGNFIVTASHDKSMRVWEKTDDQFVLSEEREMRLEKIYENLDVDQERGIQEIGSRADGIEESTDDQVDQITNMANSDTLKAGELLIEALEVWKQEQRDFEKFIELRKNNQDAAPPIRNPFSIKMGASEREPDECVLQVVCKIRPSHLNDALMALPFSLVMDLVECVSKWIEKGIDSIISSKILLFLLKFHHDEIVSTGNLKPTLEKIRSINKKDLSATREKIGFNIFGLQYLLREYNARKVFSFDGRDATQDSLPIENSSKRKLKIV